MKNGLHKSAAIILALLMTLGTAGCGKETPPADTEGMPIETVSPEDDTVAAMALQEAFEFAAEAPEVSAQAAILVENDTGTILFDKNAREKMYPASMTKMITALVVMDYFQQDELLTVGTEINEISWDSSKAGHIVGETLTVKNLIRGLIIPSGNDSANVLAAAVAKRVENNSELSFEACEEIFAELMNEKAAELGAINTHFTNAHGYHDENHYSCAYDMALFARAYLQNSTLKEIANEKSFSGNGADNMFAEGEGLKTQDYVWRSHNLLITNNEYSYGYASGIKTGFTDEAGHCVSAAAEKDGETLIAIIFHSDDTGRWVDGKNLFEYGFNSYQRVELARAGNTLEEAALTKQNPLEGDTLRVVFYRDIIAYLPEGAQSRVTMTNAYLEEYKAESKDETLRLKAPIAEGAQIGTVAFQLDGKTMLTDPVYAQREVTKGTILNYIQYFFKNFVSIVFSVKGLIGLVVIVVVVIIILLLLRMLGGRRRRYVGGYTFRKPAGKKRRGRRRF